MVASAAHLQGKTNKRDMDPLNDQLFSVPQVGQKPFSDDMNRIRSCNHCLVST